MTLTTVGDLVLAALAKSSGACGQAGLDCRFALDPVGESILTVLDDGLRGLVSVIGCTRLAWCDWGIINEVEQVLAVASDDGGLLAMLSEGIELVCERSLQLFSGDVGELGLCDQRLSLSSDKFLLKDHNTWRVGILVLQLCDLIGDLVLAVSRGLYAGLNVTD